MQMEPTASEDPPFDGYHPLPRPLLFPNKKSLISDDEDSEVSDDSDSDNSDVPIRKRTKRTFDKSSTKSSGKYDVWAVQLRANDLMDEIGNLDTNTDRAAVDTSRDVESYFRLGVPEGATEEEKKELLQNKLKKKNVKERLGKKNRQRQRHQSGPASRDTENFERRCRSESRSGNKQANDTTTDGNRFRSLSHAVDPSCVKTEKTNVKSRLGKRGKQGIKSRLGPHPDIESNVPSHGTPRELLDLKVTSESDPADVVQDIASKLYEQKDDLIQQIVDVLGPAKAIEIYNETKEVEAKGGMLVMNATRRRTPGGVYIQLLKKGSLTPEQVHDIFDQDKRVESKIRRLRAKRRRAIKYKKLRETLTNVKVEVIDDDLKPLPTRKEVFATLCKSVIKTEVGEISFKMEDEDCETTVKEEAENGKSVKSERAESDVELEIHCDTSLVKAELESLDGVSESSEMEMQPCGESEDCSSPVPADIETVNGNNISEAKTNEEREHSEEGECSSDLEEN